MPAKNSTPEIEIQRSPRSVSNGTASVPAGWPTAAIGIRSESWSQQDRLERGAAEHRLGRETGDRLRHQVPQADHAGAVDKNDAVADVREHPCRLRARLDLVVQAGGIDRQRDDARERGRPAEIVRGERAALLAADQRQRAERAAVGDGGTSIRELVSCGPPA